MPCSDELVSDAAQDETHLVSAPHDQHEHDEAAGDFCTPFCHCHCCHSHATFFAMLEPSLPFAQFSEECAAYSFPAEPRFPSSIFQPPRV